MLSSFVKAANMILTQRGIEFNETELYLFIGRKIPNSDERIVTLDSLVKFVRNFGPWNLITNKVNFLLTIFLITRCNILFKMVQGISSLVCCDSYQGLVSWESF